MYMELGKFDEFGKVQSSGEMHTEPRKCGVAVLGGGGAYIFGTFDRVQSSGEIYTGTRECDESITFQFPGETWTGSSLG